MKLLCVLLLLRVVPLVPAKGSFICLEKNKVPEWFLKATGCFCAVRHQVSAD